MAASTARTKYLRIAPRKVRLVANLIRGKKVAEARAILEFTVKRSAPVLKKLLESAVANVESQAAEKKQRVHTDDMVIDRIHVDGGPTTRNYMPQPRGRATRIRKRSSHVTLSIKDTTE
jgi:large subunit ribosomal protein L22